METLQAKDLRIGNKVRVTKKGGYNQIGEIITVESINREGINSWKDMGASGLNAFDGIEGVLLTKEILEKCGFEFLYFKEWGFSDINFIFNIVGFETANISAGGLADGTFGIDIECKFVHQLQTLFYALTGEELDINL